MSDVKRVIKHLAIIYLLAIGVMLLNIEMIPYVFPFRHLSTFFLLFLSAFLVFYYRKIVVPRSNMKWFMVGIAVMIVIFILLQGMKYTIVNEIETLARYLWYLYYVPMTLISLLLLYISMCVFEKDKESFPRKWIVFGILAAALILLVLTNDHHQWVFQFQENFAGWNSNYTYGLGFYFVALFQYGVFIAAVWILLSRCRISGVRGRSWLIMIPFLLGIVVILLLITEKIPKINGKNIMEVPETYCFMVVGVLECCLQLGLIPSNIEYKEIFHMSSVMAQIIDRNEQVVFRSKTVPLLTKDQYELPSGSRMEEHMLLRKINVPGGQGIWLEDVEELDQLNEKLTEARDRLHEEMELLRIQNEWNKKQAKVTQRTILYDEIAKNTYRQSRLISDIAKASQNSSDLAIKENGRKRITLLSSYMKRYANLMLLAEDHTLIDVGELALSYIEILRRVNQYGIPGELLNTARNTIQSSAAHTVFETFEYLLEESIDLLKGIYITLMDGVQNVSCKITLENVTVQLPPNLTDKLKNEGIQNEVEYEDYVTYLRFVLPGGGRAE